MSAASAAPADIDRTFGQEGVARVQSEQGAHVSPEDMAVTPGGEIYVLRSALGCSAFPCVGEQLVSRFTPGGLLDSSFGFSGVRRVFTAADGFNASRGGSLAVAPDGGIVIGSTDGGDLVLARLNPDGSPDAGFGKAGVAKIHLSAPVDRVRLAIQADGRIVVGAEPLSGYGGDAVLVARYTAQGAPDPTFRDGNPLITSLGSGLGGMALSGTRTVIAGPRCCGAEGRAVHLARINESGIFDNDFGRQGETFIDDVTDRTGVGALVVLPKGGIYVVGSGRNDKGNAFVMKLRASGTLDLKFGHRGIAYLRHSYLDVSGAKVDRAGRLLIAGSAPQGTGRGPAYGPSRFALLRLLSSGKRDSTFAGGSLIRLDSLDANRAVAIGLQEGRRLVALTSGGQCIRTCQSPTALLVRFLGGTSASRCQGKRATIVGTRHGERLVGTRHRDVIAGLAGNDLIFGRGGNDLICGGRGDDRLVGGKGRDVLRGGAGRNRLSQ
ncbi:MAG TPA: hypothetical protein VFT10_01845 [Solirubrobacterales bacterium]|nr:hypothetical protein [Solirubrobacterales bacterium]